MRGSEREGGGSEEGARRERGGSEEGEGSEGGEVWVGIPKSPLTPNVFSPFECLARSSARVCTFESIEREEEVSGKG